MKKRNIFFGLILISISIIIGMAKVGKRDINENNIRLLKKDDVPRLSSNHIQKEVKHLNGPEFGFASNSGYNHLKIQKAKYSPTFNLGSGSRYEILSNSRSGYDSENSARSRSSISGCNINFKQQNRNINNNTGLMALTAVGRNNYGYKTQLNLEPFVETGSTARIDTGGNVGDPVPAGDSEMPLAILSIAWILVISVKRAHKS